MCDELSARSWSLAEHFKSSQMVESSHWFGKAEAKAKFCSSPSHFPLQLTACLPASPHLLCPSRSARALGAGSACVRADDFCYVAGRLPAARLRCEPQWEPFVLCPLQQSASHPVPQGSLCFFGDSGPWAVMGSAPCARGKFSFQFICLKFSRLHAWPRQSPLDQRLQLGRHWEQDASLQKVQDVGFRLFPGSGSFLGKYKTGFKQTCLPAAHASAVQALQGNQFLCKPC